MCCVEGGGVVFEIFYQCCCDFLVLLVVGNGQVEFQCCIVWMQCVVCFGDDCFEVIDYYGCNYGEVIVFVDFEEIV